MFWILNFFTFSVWMFRKSWFTKEIWSCLMSMYKSLFRIEFDGCKGDFFWTPFRWLQDFFHVCVWTWPTVRCFRAQTQISFSCSLLLFLLISSRYELLQPKKEGEMALAGVDHSRRHTNDKRFVLRSPRTELRQLLRRPANVRRVWSIAYRVAHHAERNLTLSSV